MNTIFINPENSKTSKAHILIVQLINELDFRRSEKIIALSNIIAITINSKYQHQHGMKNLNYLMDHIQYHIFKIILSRF